MPADMTPEQQAQASGQLTPEQEAEIAAQVKRVGGVPGMAATVEKALRQKFTEQNKLTTVDSKNYQYGGTAGGADEAANRYRAWAEGAQNRQGVQADFGMANQARSYQEGMAGLMDQRARGLVPSIAQMQADRQMQQAAAEQSSAAAGARGPAALALAQQNAAANTAAMQGNISASAQMNAANERLQAEQAAFGAHGAMRASDQSQAMGQAGLDDAQKSRNDQAMMGMTGFETGVRTTQLGADMGFQGQKNSSNMAYAQLEAQRKAAKEASDRASTGQMLQTGAAVAGTAAMMSDVTAKQNIAPLGGAGGMGSMFAPPGQQPMGAAGAGSYLGGGVAGAGMTGASMTNPVAGGYQPAPSGVNWNALGQGLMGVSRSFAPQYGSGSMLSDERAKTNAFQMGTAAGLSMAGADPRAAAWDEGHKQALADMQKLARKSPDELKAYGDNPLAVAVRGLKADAWDEGRSSYQPDPSTQQFAQGLAPSAYEYKEGMGTPGQKVGPMAQNMAANPITATAVRSDPATGLMSIDRDDGLKVALAAGGHNAAKMTELERQIAEIQQRTKVQGEGLLSQGPSVGEHYLQTVRGVR